MPWRAARDIANSFRQLAIIHTRCFRLKPGELVKLLDRAGHHETASRVMVAVLVLVRNNVAVFIRKYGPIGEGERVPIVIETIG